MKQIIYIVVLVVIVAGVGYALFGGGEEAAEEAGRGRRGGGGMKGMTYENLQESIRSMANAPVDPRQTLSGLPFQDTGSVVRVSGQTGQRRQVYIDLDADQQPEVELTLPPSVDTPVQTGQEVDFGGKISEIQIPQGGKPQLRIGSGNLKPAEGGQ